MVLTKYLYNRKTNIFITVFLFSTIIVFILRLKSSKKKINEIEIVSDVKYIKIISEHKNFFDNNNIFQDRAIKGDPVHLLSDIFRRADIDKNQVLSLSELKSWIYVNIQQHIDQAMRENFIIFSIIDHHPKDGVISWQEYHSFYLKSKGLNESYVKNHDKRHKGLERPMKDAIMRDRAAWSEAAKTDPDSLNLEEFLSFRHPESSHSTIINLVEDLIEKFDQDGDESLTEDEFSSGDFERKVEFRQVIDKNGDGKADRKELIKYVDPRHPRHARAEAETLILLADFNNDGNLSLEEILNKKTLFLGSKLFDAATSFHDEF